MAEQQLSAPERTVPPVRRSAAGVTHVREHQPNRYTIIGNHLAQHRKLSAVAIGLATYIQSLPDNAPVDIRTLTARFTEGATRIAAALRELERFGYLSRIRERTRQGRIITRTFSFTCPQANRPCRTPETPAPDRTAPPSMSPAAARTAAPPTAPGPVPPTSAPPPHAAPRPAPHGPADADADADNGTDTTTVPTPPTAPREAAQPSPPGETGAPPTHRVPPPPLPQPDTPSRPDTPDASDPQRDRTAAALLADLRRADTRLLLSAHDLRRLTPAAATWLARGVTPAALRHALTTGLPGDLRSPYSLLAHRLTALLPPPLPPTPPPRTRPVPLQTCDSCDRAFRSPTPGHCRDCRSSAPGPRDGRDRMYAASATFVWRPCYGGAR
jgi:hypothetical protein